VSRQPIADGWYGWQLDGVDFFETWLDARPAPLARAARRVGALRGLLLFAASVRRPAAVVMRTDPGWRSLLLARALFGRRRKLVVTHFIALPSGGRWWEPVDGWATRRALRRAQVLSAFEVGAYARRYGVDRFVHVPFAGRYGVTGELPARDDDGPVLAAGRAACDWPTLFAAADGASWPLVVVCSSEDRPEVDRLNAGGRAEVHTDLVYDDAMALLRRASVCAIVMREAEMSTGHVRLADATEAGVPVVATATRSLEGYLNDGETGLLVAPGDAKALRTAIDRLVADRALAGRLRAAAFERAGTWTFPHYLAALGRLAK
jgi:hypothetical protein